jgi:hypothetical protein
VSQWARDVDAVVFTHGSNSSQADMEAVDYGGVRNVLTVLPDRPVRILLMTLIGVTNRDDLALADRPGVGGQPRHRRRDPQDLRTGRSTRGPPTDLTPLFAALDPDDPSTLDGVRDEDRLPLNPGVGASPRRPANHRRPRTGTVPRRPPS